MLQTQIPLTIFPPRLNNWVQLSVCDETHAKNQVYTNPWNVTYDDEDFSLGLLNQSLYDNKFVQLFLPHERYPYSSKPATVQPGFSLNFDLRKVLEKFDNLEGLGFYVRWINKEGVQLVWPIAW